MSRQESSSYTVPNNLKLVAGNFSMLGDKASDQGFGVPHPL